MIKRIGGWGNFSIFCLLLAVLAYSYLHKQSRLNDPLYIKGISEGLKKEVRGSIYLHYSFVVNNEQFEGHVSNDFCKQCFSCCDVGDTVIVRFQRNNPQNNDLVVKLPKGANLEDNQ